jgi:hypothetical protein
VTNVHDDFASAGIGEGCHLTSEQSWILLGLVSVSKESEVDLNARSLRAKGPSKSFDRSELLLQQVAPSRTLERNQ